MKSGKDKRDSKDKKGQKSEKATSSEKATFRVQPQPEEVQAEQKVSPAIVPVNLLAAVEKIRSGGAVPVFITRELEKFLTEQGVFRDDMRPAEAWEKLNEIAGNAPEPEPPAAS